ncbi:MAG: HAD family hydrolase [Actinomycetia bacterium]|nr:HAD family hydrolase [Actinomycetes bacterium]
MADHIVWDWNGTLWDDLPQVHRATNAALREIGGPALTLAEYVGLFTRPLPMFYRRALGRDLTPAEWEMVNRCFMVSYQGSLHLADLATEAIPALDWVARNGATQSILSLYPHQSLTRLVEELGITHYFTRVDGLRGMPDRSKVGMFHDHLTTAAPGIRPHRVVMIGDTDDDLLAAQAAGSTGILINHHGYHPLGDPTLVSFFADGLLEALQRAGLRISHGRYAVDPNPAGPGVTKPPRGTQ